MFSYKHYINSISAIFIVIISSGFFYKICKTYLSEPLFLAVIFGAAFIFVLVLLDKNNFFLKKKFLIVLALIVLGIQLWGLTFVKVPNYTAEFWIERFLNGSYPYFAFVGFGMPIFYSLLVPFYLIGNIALSDSLGFVLLALVIIGTLKESRESTIGFFILLLSPMTFFGILYFSGKILLSALFILFMILTARYREGKKYNVDNVLISVLFGFLVSSYFEMIFIVIIFYLFLYRNDLVKMLTSFLITFISFLATLLPFIKPQNEFLFHNSIFSNSVFLHVFPLWGIILLLLAIIYIGWIVSNLQEIFFSLGIILFLVSGVELLALGKATEIISNFLMVLPFFIVSIRDYKVDEFLGRVYPNAN